MSRKPWDKLIASLRQTVGAFPERRTGDNLSYSMADIALSAFSVFFTQSPSFLSSQTTLAKAKARSNANPGSRSTGQALPTL
jgi:hypothetical protein